MTPPPLPASQPVKKSNALMWILLCVGGLVFMIALAIGVSSYFVYRTVKKAGFDPELMRNNPGLALARMATSLNPDTEVVSTDNAAGTIVVRERSTGKIVTMKFDPNKKTMVVVGDDGKEAKITASGDSENGRVEVQGPDGTVTFGATSGNSGPAWLPVYPGSAPSGTISSQTPEGSENTYAFKTADAPSKVLSYFQDQLKSEGFTVNLAASGEQGGMLQAEHSGKKRNVVVTVGSSSEGTAASITAIEKK